MSSEYFSEKDSIFAPSKMNSSMAENRIIGRDYEQHILQNICEEEEARLRWHSLLFGHA